MDTKQLICPKCGGFGQIKTIVGHGIGWHSEGTNTAFVVCNQCGFEGHHVTLYQDEIRAKYECKMMLNIIGEYQGKEAVEKRLMAIVGTMDDAIEYAQRNFMIGRTINRVQREV